MSMHVDVGNYICSSSKCSTELMDGCWLSQNFTNWFAAGLVYQRRLPRLLPPPPRLPPRLRRAYCFDRHAHLNSPTRKLIPRPAPAALFVVLPSLFLASCTLVLPSIAASTRSLYERPLADGDPARPSDEQPDSGPLHGLPRHQLAINRLCSSLHLAHQPHIGAEQGR